MATTYVGFVAVALGFPAGLLAVWAAVRRPYRGLKRQSVGLLVLAAAAVLYTVPLEAAMIARGVTTHGGRPVADRVLGIPLGDPLAVGLYTLLAGLWLYHVDYADPIPDVSLPRGVTSRLVGVGAGGLIGAAGVGVAMPLDGSGIYLGSTLVWAAPVLALQWGVGWTFLWQQRSVLLSAVAIPTVYLWLVAALAHRWGLWAIEPRTGPEIAGLPAAEMVFLGIATLLVVQGHLLWYWVIDRRRRRAA